MKKLLLTAVLLLAIPTHYIEASTVQTKKVCKTINKTTKCRNIKIHKKHVGTPVPAKIKK